MSRAKVLIELVMGTESLDMSQSSIYRKALLCRLEVQYSLALLHRQAMADAKRTKSSRINPERLPFMIFQYLSKSAASLQDGEMNMALEELQAADSLLGRFISSLRNKKNKSGGKEEP
jgi:hypothetical protein